MAQCHPLSVCISEPRPPFYRCQAPHLMLVSARTMTDEERES